MKIEDIDKLISTEANMLFQLITKLMHFHFEFAIELLHYKGMNYIVEGLFIIPQLFQWLSISFSTIHEKHWNNDLIHKKLKNYVDYFMINRLFSTNNIMLYVLFYGSFVFLVVLYAIYLLIMITYFKSNTLRTELIKQMKPFIFGVMTLLYMPLLDLFCSIIHCRPDNQSLFISSLTCWNGFWFLHFAIGVLGVMMTVCLTLVFQPVVYISGYSARVLNAKKTGKIDQINAIVKFLTILLYAILYGTEDEEREWVRIVFSAFTGNYLIYCYYSKSPYYNDLMMKFQLIKSSIYSWANFVLILCKMNELIMTMAFHLFLTGIPLLVYLIAINKSKEQLSFLYSMHQLVSEEDIDNQIRALIKMTEERNKERKYLLAIYQYIECQEDSKVVGSPLYNFIHYSENVNNTSDPGKESESVLLYYLYQHIEEIHQYSLAKYPFSSILLLSYAVFLHDKRGKNKQAVIELSKAELNICTFEQEFCIYRLKKEIIEYGKSDPLFHDGSSHRSKFSKGKPHDVSTMIGYQYNFNIFTSSINEISMAYLNFWTLLLSTQKGIRDGLNSLTEYGVKIHNLTDKIQNSFLTLQTIKPNDYHVLSLYASFLKNIKNDISQYDMYQKLLSNSNMDKHLFEENNLLLLNISSLDTSGYYYVISSSKVDSFEMITNISIEFCKILGYRKEELLGKELEVLMPDFLKIKHKQILRERYHKYLQVREISKNKGALREFRLFAKNQSKYLIPILLKGGFVPNETEDIFLFSKLIIDELRAKQCFILTNTNTIIQHCTSNALSMLNVSSYLFNGNIDIMNYIKEFYEGYVNAQIQNNANGQININMNNKRNQERDKEQVKQQILKEKYCQKKTSITWRNIALDNTTVKKNESCVTINCIRRESIKNPHVEQDRKLLMTLEEIYFNNSKEAYVFGFKIEDECLMNMKHQRNSMMTASKNKKVKQFGYSITPSNDKGLTILSNKTLTILNEDYDLGLGNNFIPETKKISFDPNTLSYTMEEKNNETNNVYNTNYNSTFPNEKLSVILEKKVRNCFNQKEPTSKSLLKESSSSSSSSYYNDSNYDPSNKANDSENELDNKSSIEEEEFEVKMNKNENKESNNNEEYYKVDISKIRYFIYNYKAKQVIEEISYAKISQIDTKISKEPQKEFISSLEPQNKKSKIKSSAHIANSSNNNPKEILNLDNSNQGTIQLINRVDSSILFLRIINTFICVVFLTMGSVNFVFLFSLMKKHQKISSFISSQSVLLSNYQYLLFYSLEIVLVNNDKYAGYYQPRDEYSSILKSSLLSIFNESLLIIQTLSTDNSPFSDRIRNNTNELKIQVRVLSLPYNFVLYNLSVFDALFEVLSASYNFAHYPIERQIFVNDDFIFIVFNNDKTILNGIINMIDIYQNELLVMATKDRITMGVFILGFIVGLVIAFKLVLYGFDRVQKKKKSYLKVFLNINEFIIKQLIDKCEIIIGTREQALYSNTQETRNDNDDEETTTLSSASIPNSNSNDNGTGSSELEKQPNKRNKKANKTTCFKGYHLLIGIVLISIIISVYIFFWLRLTKISQYSDIYQLFTQNESKYLSLINSAKLYSMFSTIGLKEINNYRIDLVYFLATIYSFNENINANITDSIEQRQFPSNATKKYYQIFESNICYYLTQTDNLKNTNLTCTTFAGGILSFGLNFAFAYYIDQVRNLKIMIEKATQEASLTKFTFNEGYYGTPFYDVNLPKDPEQLELYKKLNPFNVFNTEQFKTINLLLINVFCPAFKEIRNSIELAFDTVFNFDNKLNWIFMGFYCVFILLVFVLFLLRKERISNNELQKTKSLLTIIPKNELLKIKDEAESQ